MSRIALVEPARAGWLGRLVYRMAAKRFGAVPEPLRAQMNHRGLTFAGLVHELAVERASKRLDPALRELVVYRVATVVGCSWCVDFGLMLQRGHGLSIDRLQRIDSFETSAEYTDDERLALRYADAMTAQPMTVTDELVAELRGRFDDARLVELTYQIALENQRARMNKALGLTDQGFTSGAACRVPDRALERPAASRG